MNKNIINKSDLKQPSCENIPLQLELNIGIVFVNKSQKQVKMKYIIYEIKDGLVEPPGSCLV